MTKKSRNIEFAYKNLVKDESFEKRIKITCPMSSAKCEFIQGKIIDLDNTNGSFIEPHRIVVEIKSRKIIVSSRYAKILIQYISYICKKKKYQATVITVVSNIKKEVNDLKYVNSGKRGRPKKELTIYDRIANELYKGNYHTD
ncbi:MAG: hypothetical protein ACK5HL_03075 [Bacilli bacterium]